MTKKVSRQVPSGFNTGLKGGELNSISSCLVKGGGDGDDGIDGLNMCMAK